MAPLCHNRLTLINFYVGRIDIMNLSAFILNFSKTPSSVIPSALPVIVLFKVLAVIVFPMLRSIAFPKKLDRFKTF